MNRPERVGLFAVVTTVHRPTACVRRLAAVLEPVGGRLITVGDKKGPDRFDVPGAEFVSLEAQLKLPFALAPRLPTGHYTRKNLGYLLAMARGATCIYETDDDNAPNDAWRRRSLRTDAQPVASRSWFNVYRAFADELIWPRGFPLDLIRDESTWQHDVAAPLQTIEAPVQQGLVDQSPDVDAIWRLLVDREFHFPPHPSVWLPPGTWCPFNSQCTWWWPAAFPLLYLPTHTTFRMTDIWRSFIAQRCLWELGVGVVFHASEANQERNVHNLMVDFRDELPGYQDNRQLTELLERTGLESGEESVGTNLRRCYESLVAERLLPEAELMLVDAWLEDLTPVPSRRQEARRAIPEIQDRSRDATNEGRRTNGDATHAEPEPMRKSAP